MNRLLVKSRAFINASIIIVVLAVVAVGASSSATAQTLRMPPHEKIVLKNGLTVLLLQKHGVPLVNISTIVKAGSAADPARPGRSCESHRRTSAQRHENAQRPTILR